MEQGSYTIEVDAANRLVTLELVGFWSTATAIAFAQEEQAAVRTIASRPHQHLVLVDLSCFAIQPQSVVGICRALIADTRLPARRLAVVAGEGLARIQVKRLMVRDEMEVFPDRSKATAWLLAGEQTQMRRVAG